MKNLMTCLTVCVLSGAVAAEIHHVPADFPTIQLAVDAAVDGDEIIVAPGTYTSTADEVVNMLGKEVWLHSSGGQEVTFIDGQGTRRGIICWNYETSKTVIEGFTIANCFSFWQGAGMHNWRSSPTLTNCTFTNNFADDGGGMVNEDNSIPTLTDCTFENNTAHFNGGGMYNHESSPTLTNCTFTNNFAIDNGGMYNFTSSPTLHDCEFIGNSGFWGGGMSNWDSSNPMLTSCNFTGNSGVVGSGMYNLNNSNPTLTNCTFTNNSADEGGGMYNITDSNPTLTDCTFENNTANYYGGGMYNLDNSNPTLTDCTFTGNTATSNDGGGMFNFHSSPTFNNCTFENNAAINGGAFTIHDAPSHVLYSNCTMIGNTASWAGAGIYLYNNSDTFGVTFDGESTSDDIFCTDGIGGPLMFTAESTCEVNGFVTPSSLASMMFDLDNLATEASLDASSTIIRQGSLAVTNESGSLIDAQVGNVIPLARTSNFEDEFNSIVFPLMPEGLGLQLIEYPALRGSDTEMAVEVIEVEGAQFANPFAGGLDSPPVDIKSFDADGDGADEIAVLFDGAPGGVAVFAVSEDSAPSLIDGFSAVVGNNPVDLDAGDLNGDGLEDLLVANGTSETMTVLVTTLGGDNSLTFAVQQISCDGPVTSAAVTDWDGDTDLDAVVGQTDPSGYQVLLDVATTASSGPWFPIPYYGLPSGDYVSDSPTCVHGGNQTSAWGFVGGTQYGRVHRAIPNGSLQIVAELGGNNIATMEVIELDADGGDGQIDLMVASDEAETIYLFQGNASENDGFEDLIPLAVSEPVEDVLAIDADDDGDMDLVMTAPTSDTSLVLLRNDGGSSGLVGGLNGIAWSKQDMNSGNPLSDIEPIDVNDDKDIDKQVIVGAGGAPNLRGEPAGTMEQTNILLDSDCVADIDGDGEVNVADLLILIGAWGSCPGCEADLDDDGEANVADLLLLIGAWGPCE